MVLLEYTLEFLFKSWLYILAVGVLFLSVFPKSVFVCNQWERKAVLRFGKIIRIVDGGLNFKIPYVDTTITVDIRTQELDLQSQTMITKDNISVGVDAVLFIKTNDPQKLILNVLQYKTAITRASQAALRNIVGNYELDDLLEHRDEIADKLESQIHDLADDWGLEVVRIGLQDISLPEDMKRAFAVQAEAERESRAIQIKAKAELEASDKLTQAAKKMKEETGSMQLRILQTVNDISKDQSNTIILALPLETLQGINVGDIAAMSSIGSSHAKLKESIIEILGELNVKS